MKAACYEETGPAAQVLKLIDLPDPRPGSGEVRVRLQWSGVNPSDVKSRAGLRSKAMPFPRVTPHSDGAGVIDQVGEGVPGSRIGEQVWVWNAAWGRPNGTAAEYVTLPARQAVRLPEGVPPEAGACFGIPALTALHAVQGWGGVRGRSVLVAGGAGAVGHYAVQFARLLGARQVIATVSSEAKEQLARQAGAEAVVDYRREDVAPRVLALTQGRGVDRVVEVDAAANARLDAEMVAREGEIVVYGSAAAEFVVPFFPMIVRNLTLRCFIVYNLPDSDRQSAEAMLAMLLSEGRLVHNVAERLPLSEIARAHELVESGRIAGNVVLSIGA